MKIYFTGPISRVSPEVRENYSLIIKKLQDLGHNVFADHITNKKPDDLKKQTEEESITVQRIMTKRKKYADLVIAEVSTPSFGVGQEITAALVNSKQVIALHLPGCEPHLLRDEGEDSLYIVEYTRDTLREVLEDYIDISKDQMDVRFNFFVSPRIVNYLDWIAKQKKMPRAVYLRRLIEKDMEKNKEFEKEE
jgi:2'-deoxynucleoside 5'-phosphate N-hydrolase